MEANKRPRKTNFSSQEVSVLLTEMLDSKELLMTKLTTHATNRRKKDEWRRIAHKVSVTGDVDLLRTVDEVRKKWTVSWQKLNLDLDLDLEIYIYIRTRSRSIFLI